MTWVMTAVRLSICRLLLLFQSNKSISKPSASSSPRSFATIPLVGRPEGTRPLEIKPAPTSTDLFKFPYHFGSEDFSPNPSATFLVIPLTERQKDVEAEAHRPASPLSEQQSNKYISCGLCTSEFTRCRLNETSLKAVCRSRQSH